MNVCRAVPMTAVVLLGALWSCTSANEPDSSRSPSFVVPSILSATITRRAWDAGAQATVDGAASDVFADVARDTGSDATDDMLDDVPVIGTDVSDVGTDVPVMGIDVPIPSDVPSVVDVPLASDVPIVMGTDVPPPSDAGPGTDAVPAFDSATDAHVRSIVSIGLARGNRHAVFAKIGDSITESSSFLSDCGYGWYDVGTHLELEATISYFRMVAIGTANSLNRPSICAVGGWACSDALAGSPNALTQELDAIQPLWAIVMYGTNDMQRYDIGTFVTNLSTILDIIEAHGVVPVMSTIPSRSDTEPYISMVPSFNDAIRSMASSRHLPLIDLNLALAPLPNGGISPDGIHPNVYVNPADGADDACVLTDQGLQFGYNMRNLTSLQMLTRLRSY